MSNFKLPPRETQVRVLRFLVVGGGSLLVQMAVFWLCARWTSSSVAFSISWVVSTGVHYVANRFWALPSARLDSARQLGEYLFTIAVSYLINTAAFEGLCAMGVPPLAATALAVPPSTVVVFLLLNYRVFRAKPTQT